MQGYLGLITRLLYAIEWGNKIPETQVGRVNVHLQGSQVDQTSAWSCTGGQTGDDPAVTVALGDDITCTITNDDDAPKLTLNKVVVNDNGGGASESDWTLTATGNPVTDPATLSGLGAAGNDDVVSGPGFDAGSYDLSDRRTASGSVASAGARWCRCGLLPHSCPEHRP